MNKIIFAISTIEFLVFYIGAFILVEDIIASFIFGSIGAVAVPLLELKFQKEYEQKNSVQKKEKLGIHG